MSSATTVFKFARQAARRRFSDSALFITSPLDLNDPFEMRPA